jgi:amidase
VEILRDAGAVFYVKTNVPTAMMIAESVNNVFGRTLNPLNRNLTSGGSSGGESALIAFGGSCLGVGTDIGGSLRIPAACTGIYTLRPSLGRFTTQRARSGLAGQEAVNSVNGPMARNIDDLEFFSRAVVGSRPWLVDPKCLPIPWRTVASKKTLKIGVLWHDGVVTPTPPVQRALRETVERLKGAGHTIVDWDPKGNHSEAAALLQKMFVADGGKSLRKVLDPTGEPFRPEMMSYAQAKELGAYDMWQVHLQRNELQRRYLVQWNEMGIDAILGPTTPFATVPHGKFKHVGYTGVYNILDYSAVSFPTHVKVDKRIDGKSSYFPNGARPLTKLDTIIYNECMGISVT